MSVTRVCYEIDGWGEGELWVDGKRLVWHELPRPRPPKPGFGEPRPHTPTPCRGGEKNPPPSRSTIPTKRARVENGTVPIAHRLVHRITRYFAGMPTDFSDIDLELDGWTQFQIDIVRALRRVPYGDVVSYGELARLAGHPNAQRAAGTFCARNRFGLIVPCHRVVAADGLGTYGDLGPAYKRRLLELEGVAV